VRPRPLRIGALTLAIIAACASCSHSTDGTPAATSSGGSPATAPPTTPDTYGAPRVSSPLDASTYLAQPCAVLSTKQLVTLHFPARGKPDTDSETAKTAGPACTWQSDTRATQSSFATGNKNGLSDVYRGHEQGYFEFWEPTTIAGYPAVFNDPTDLRSAGACGLNVGISDTLTILVAVEGSDADPCDPARQTASMIINTLKVGA
jgi:hypothetical protein